MASPVVTTALAVLAWVGCIAEEDSQAAIMVLAEVASVAADLVEVAIITTDLKADCPLFSSSTQGFLSAVFFFP